jgi:Flp pilus assembly protein TadG
VTRRRRGERGGTVVEFAIVLPLFCAVLFGTVDYAWYFYQKFTLAAAVQTGLRAALAVKEIDTPDPWQAAQDAAKTALDARGAISSSSVSFSPAAGSRYGGVKPGRYVILTAQYTLQSLIGFVPLPSKTLKFSATMMLDAQNSNL